MSGRAIPLAIATTAPTAMSAASVLSANTNSRCTGTVPTAAALPAGGGLSRLRSVSWACPRAVSLGSDPFLWGLGHGYLLIILETSTTTPASAGES